MAIKDFDLKDAYNLVDSKSDIAFGKGTLELLPRFGCKAGKRLAQATRAIDRKSGLPKEQPRGTGRGG